MSHIRFFDPGRCLDCGYGGELGCNYLFIIGRRRPCPPGDACTEYIPKDQRPRRRLLILPETHIKPELRTIGRTRKSPGVEALCQSETACRLYAEGASDPTIAQAEGCCPTTVRKWRLATGRPPNRKRKKD